MFIKYLILKPEKKWGQTTYATRHTHTTHDSQHTTHDTYPGRIIVPDGIYSVVNLNTTVAVKNNQKDARDERSILRREKKVTRQ